MRVSNGRKVNHGRRIVQKRQVSRARHSRGVSDRGRTGCKKEKIIVDIG